MTAITSPPRLTTLELPIAGMDCAGCAKTVEGAIAALPGVASAEVRLTSEKAIVRLDPARVDQATICKAVEGAGYRVPVTTQTLEIPIAGMDCAECASTVQKALATLPGVQAVNVLLASEKAVIQGDARQLDRATLRRAVEGAGYRIPDG